MSTNKTNEVLRHLQTHGSITSMEAINLFGATRLSAIIFNLRKKGYNITSIDKTTKDRYGHTVPYAEYRLNASTSTVSSNQQETNTLFQDLFSDIKKEDSNE